MTIRGNKFVKFNPLIDNVCIIDKEYNDFGLLFFMTNNKNLFMLLIFQKRHVMYNQTSNSLYK